MKYALLESISSLLTVMASTFMQFLAHEQPGVPYVTRDFGIGVLCTDIVVSAVF